MSNNQFLAKQVLYSRGILIKMLLIKMPKRVENESHLIYKPETKIKNK